MRRRRGALRIGSVLVDVANQQIGAAGVSLCAEVGKDPGTGRVPNRVPDRFRLADAIQERS